MTSSTVPMESSPAHAGETPGASPTDWAEIQEAQCRKLFEMVLHRSRARADARLLDMGCGSGMFGAMAAARGVRVSGIDSAAALIDIARQRTPNADLRVGDVDALPFVDNAFDSAVCINALQFTADPVKVLSEAHRVVRAGGTLVVATWGLRGDCETAAVFTSVALLVDPRAMTDQEPFALSRPDTLEDLASRSGWKPLRIEHVVCEWLYTDIETALRGLMSSGVARRAAGEVGAERVRDAVVHALDPFRKADGSYSMHNAFRYLIAEK